jgi:hypothetical protein
LLVAAVALTWYGPAARPPGIRVTVPGHVVCGTVVRTGGGALTLATGTGRRRIPLTAVTVIQAVAACG